MFRFVMWIRKRLVVRIIAAVMIVILALSAGNILIEIEMPRKRVWKRYPAMAFDWQRAMCKASIQKDGTIFK